MKKVLCGMAMGMMVSVLACKLIKKSSVCEDMVDDLMEKKGIYYGLVMAQREMTKIE